MSKEVSIILAAHGEFAVAALSSLEMIVGPQSSMKAVSLQPSDGLDDLTKKISDAYNCLERENGVVIICDIYGGTPSNAATSILVAHQDEKLAVYSGLNLAILLEIVSNRSMEFDLLQTIIQDSAKYTWRRIERKREKNVEEEGL